MCYLDTRTRESHSKHILTCDQNQYKQWVEYIVQKKYEKQQKRQCQKGYETLTAMTQEPKEGNTLEIVVFRKLIA